MRVYVYQTDERYPEYLTVDNGKKCWLFPGPVNGEQGDWCHYPSLRYQEPSNWLETDMEMAGGMLRDHDLLMDEGL